MHPLTFKSSGKKIVMNNLGYCRVVTLLPKVKTAVLTEEWALLFIFYCYTYLLHSVTHKHTFLQITVSTHRLLDGNKIHTLFYPRNVTEFCDQLHVPAVFTPLMTASAVHRMECGVSPCSSLHVANSWLMNLGFRGVLGEKDDVIRRSAWNGVIKLRKR